MTTNKPSIESLLRDLDWINRQDIRERFGACITELESLRAENERLTAWAQGTESTMHGLRAENEALKALVEALRATAQEVQQSLETQLAKANGLVFECAELKEKLGEAESDLANWLSADTPELDSERTRADAAEQRADALKARVEALEREIKELECAVWTKENLSAHDARVRRECWERVCRCTWGQAANTAFNDIKPQLKQAILGDKQ